MIGRRVSHYRITERLGAGGMGTVYRAEDERDGSPVALKFPHPHLIESGEARQRYLAIVRISLGLDHPSIVKTLDVCDLEGEVFIVKEFVGASSLRNRLDAGSRPLREILDVGHEVAGALAHAHDHSIVHGDVKPENILIGGAGEIKLADFDSATLIASADADLVWPPEVTADYTAPEVFAGEAASVRSDLYSLGVVLYEMISGSTPFFGGSHHEVAHRIIHEAPPPLPPAAPTALETLVVTLLAKSPGDRPASARTVADTLARIGGR